MLQSTCKALFWIVGLCFLVRVPGFYLPDDLEMLMHKTSVAQMQSLYGLFILLWPDVGSADCFAECWHLADRDTFVSYFMLY